MEYELKIRYTRPSWVNPNNQTNHYITQHSDVDKSRISIAESNLTSESSSSSLSSSPMTSPRNDDVINGGELTRDVTPKEPSPEQVDY